MTSTIAYAGQLTAGASATIGPTTDNGQWIIHNVYTDDTKSVKVEYGDGTYWVHVATITGSMMAFYFHATTTYKIRLTNMEGSTIQYGYDGMSVV